MKHVAMRGAIGLVAGCVAGLAWFAAAAAQGVSVSSEVQPAGTATRSMLLMDLYELTVMDTDGQLTRTDLDDDGAPKKLTVDVLYGGDLPDIPKGLTSELEPALPASDTETLRGAYRDLEKGDTIRAAYQPCYGTVISVGGDVVLSSGGYELMAAFLDIWFGDSPVDEGIKEEFLG